MAQTGGWYWSASGGVEQFPAGRYDPGPQWTGPYATEAAATAAYEGWGGGRGRPPSPGGNGRPWFVRYANNIFGGGTGPFGQPFQPSNEAEELLLQADPLVYKEFPTEAAAAAWISSATGRKDLGYGAGPVSAAKTAASNVLGLPTFSHLRGFVVRTLQVLLGV